MYWDLVDGSTFTAEYFLFTDALRYFYMYIGIGVFLEVGQNFGFPNLKYKDLFLIDRWVLWIFLAAEGGNDFQNKPNQ